MNQYLADSDRKMKEFRAEMQQAREKSAREMKEFREEMRRAREESDRKADKYKQENDRKLEKYKNENDLKLEKYRKEGEAIRKQMWKQWGDLANKMGTIVEDIVAPGLRGIGREYFQIEEFDYFAPRLRLRRENRSRTREFDVVAYSPEYFFLVETKSSARTSYISDFINFIPEIPAWFPLETRNRKLVPVFASLYIDKEAIAYLTKNNILAMATRDDGMDIYHPEIIKYL